MGKAARLKKQRAVLPPPVGKQRPRNEMVRIVWGASGGVVLVVAVVVATLLVNRASPKPPGPAAASLSDRNAPAALINAAAAVGFHPTTEPGVGEMEGRAASAAGPPSNPDLLAVGTVAPSFTLKTPQGEKVSLAAYRGKAVLLEFFATWCPHCNAEAPHLHKLYASLPHSKIAFVAVNADGETAPSVFAFHRYYGLQYPALVDPSSQAGSFTSPGSAGTVSTAYRVEAFPTFYVIGPNGKITFRSDGEQPDALLHQELLAAAPNA
jgi:peroxiredoxin